MPQAASVDVRARAQRRFVRPWLYLVAALIGLMVVVGGATRLTGSGLSITEWRPVTGAIPPLTQAGWQTEFARYEASPQYHLLNQGMSLDEFKFIYGWEWSHRQLGRLIGLVFFVPLAWFWFTGAITGRFVLRLVAIGALGGIQAGIGWIMVASGLQPGMTAVAPVKLMLHLLCASALLVLVVWSAAGLGRPTVPRGERRGSVADGAVKRADWQPPILLALIFIQIAFGALMAGSKAGLTYNTWPLMDGRLIPSIDALTVVRPWYENLVDNPTLVQLDHRMMAYAVVAFAMWHAWNAARLDPGSAHARGAARVALVALAQMALGITTLVLAVPLWAGLAHQALAMALLVVATAYARVARTAPGLDLSPVAHPQDVGYVRP